jgi:uncharacterized membrane protein
MNDWTAAMAQVGVLCLLFGGILAFSAWRTHVRERQAREDQAFWDRVDAEEEDDGDQQG